MSGKALLILIDGMRPDSISECGDRNFQTFFESGSYTYSARTVFPPVTLPAMLSLFYSVSPGKHGVTTNIFTPMDPSLMGLMEVLAKEQKKSAVFYSWQELRDLASPRGGTVAFSWMMDIAHHFPETDVDTAAADACRQYLVKYLPDFCFLYLGMPDEIGHRCGWMSPEYLERVRVARECVDRVVSALPPDYSVIITADHGGHGMDHGEDVTEDMTIPVCCTGPAFEKGKELKGSVSILDIAPTITEILGAKPDPGWEGKSLVGR